MRTQQIFTLVICIIVFSSGTSMYSQDLESGKAAPKIVDQLVTAMGGEASWQKVRTIGFHYIFERDNKVLADYRHDWDRRDNRYRVEGTNRDGQHFVTIFNTHTKEGDVYLDGEKVTADSTRNKFLENAYGRYINDSYWLLMPFKLNEPGVILKYDQETRMDGRFYDVLKLTFDNVGLTPGDTYWVYVDRETHLVHRWEYFLQGWPQDRERSASGWLNWQDFNGVKLALDRSFDNRQIRIYFKEVYVSQESNPDVFDVTTKTF